MVVDIASQKPLNDIFCESLNHHRINQTTSNGTALRNNQISMGDDLARRAQRILGSASEQVDYSRQTSIDLHIPHSRKLSSAVIKQNISDLNAIKKERVQVTSEQLVPLIMKLVTLLPMTKFPSIIRRPVTKTTESDENSVKSNDNENDSNDDYENEKNNNNDTNDNETDENENHEEEDDNDNDDDDAFDESFRRKCMSDNFNHDSNQTEVAQATTNDEMLSDSEPENDDDNPSDPTTFSLSYFVPKPGQSPKTEHESNSITTADPILPAAVVDSNPSISRKEELIRSFSSSINMPIDFKQPTLPITIPKHFFLDQLIPTDSKQNRSKRPADDHENPLPSNFIPSSKKTKISHKHENSVVKSEDHQLITIKTESNLPLKTEENNYNVFSSMSMPPPVVLQQQTQGKPMASVKPLLQSTSSENLPVVNSNTNLENNSDRLTTNNMVSVNPNRRNYIEILRNSTTKQLNSIAKQKKREADATRRQTFDEIRQSMSLYLESVCYFIQCVQVEPVVEQRVILLSATLAMLDHLAQNHSKMFYLSNTQLLSNLRQKFLLINYWLQSFLFKLRYQTDWTSIERCASQVNDHLNQRKSPSSKHLSDEKNNVFYEFSKYMIASVQSDTFWNKADRLSREPSLKEFLEQLTKQNQNRRLSRDDQMSDFILYIFDAIDLLRSTVA